MYARRFRLGLVAGTAIATGLTTNAAAAATEEESSTPVEEVVVTAQKRTERLIDVPMSVAAVSGEQLQAAGISSTLDLQQVTPGVVTTNNGLGFSPSIRGITSSGTTPGDETNVAIYVDDVYVGAPIAGFFDLQDIERVEVLKGPQGTLFGRNATGGAIRIVTREPSFTPHMNLSADYGFNFRDGKLGAYFTGPVVDDVLAGSFSATYHRGDGFIDGVGPNAGRRYGKPDNYVFRGKLLFKPLENLRATLAADTWQEQNDVVFIAAPPPGVNPYAGSVATSAFHYAGSTQPIALVSGNDISLDATWDPSKWLTARSITGYREVRGRYQSDVDRTSLSLSALALRQNQYSFSQEFNVSGPSDETITWLAGAYYYHSDADNPNFTVYVNADAPDGTPFSNNTDGVSTDSYAGFGDVTWNITSQLHLTGGARYSTETKDYHYQVLVPSGIPQPVKTNDHTWKSPTYRGVLRYDLSNDANVYASWSTGFKSGVYNAYSSIGIPVDPEKIEAVEIGTKARVGDFNFTAAAYDYVYKNLQVQAHTNINGVLVTTLTNAANARVRGIELNADTHITEHLLVAAGVNWLPTAKYNGYTQASVVVPIPGSTGPVYGQAVVPYDASGSRMIKAPNWTPDMRVTYTTPVLGGEFTGYVSDAYTSGFFWQAGNLTKEGAYNVLNTRFSWTDPQDRFTYSFWITNLTDALYSTYTTPNARGDSNTYPQGREFGVGAAVKF
jgi:iron complex outermembrane receptor protein